MQVTSMSDVLSKVGFPKPFDFLLSKVKKSVRVIHKLIFP